MTDKPNFEEAIQALKDAMVVTANMSLRQEHRIKEHQEWLRQHEASVAVHEQWLKDHEAAMLRLDAKIEKIADLILKGRGGNGQ